MHSAHAHIVRLVAFGPQARSIPGYSNRLSATAELIPDVGQSSRIIEPVTSFISMLRHLGGVGVFILAALDSSVLPTLGAVDALTIVLAARHPELWSYYAMCSTRSAGLLSLTACCTWSPPSTY